MSPVAWLSSRCPGTVCVLRSTEAESENLKGGATQANGSFSPRRHHERTRRHPRPHPAADQAPIAIAPDRTALLVIDVQRYFVRPEASFGQVFERLVPGVTAGYFERVRDMVLPNIRRLQEGFRARGMPITTLSDAMHRSAVECFNIAFGRVRSTAEMLELLHPAGSTMAGAPPASRAEAAFVGS